MKPPKEEKPEIPKCSNCAYGEEFKARADEPSAQGCCRLGWEGYTRDAAPACGGKYYEKRKEKASAVESHTEGTILDDGGSEGEW